jgi:tetratricopeptide (TPR) repeat protein
VRVLPPGGDPLTLTPLLSVQRCDVCGQWAAFYLDRYDPAKHRAWFLDFVEGHTNEHKNLEPLRHWTERVSEADWKAAAARLPDPDERREPDPERFRDFQHEFEPPVYLARQVADFLTSHDRGVIWLTGPGGVGKSWVTLGLDHAAMLPAVLGRAVAVLHASMHGPTPPRATEVWSALAERARRVKRWQVPPWPDGPTPHSRFAAWLSALMRSNGLGELVVALDGLDDLPADSDVPDLWPPADELPPGCYLVLSSRPPVRAAAEAGLRRVRGAVDHFRELPIGPGQQEHRAVLRAYAEKRLARLRPDGEPPLPAAWVEPLIDLAEGSFLYVFHYCRALHFGVYADLSDLPPPGAYYPTFFDHLRGRVGDELFEGCYARTLALIAVARDPVGVTHLTAWGLERSRLVVVLDDLADLLRSRREPWDAETLYSLGHDAIRQFVTQDPAWQKRLASASRFLAELTVQRFRSDWYAVDPFDPVASYLLFHLLDHAEGTELQERVLGDRHLANACLGHGITLRNRREFEPSLLAFHTAVRLREDQAGRQGRREVRGDLAAVRMRRGNALTDLGRLEEGLADYDACIPLFEELGRGEDSPEWRDELASAYMNRSAALRRLGRLEEALADCDACTRLREELPRGDGGPESDEGLASAYLQRGNVLTSLGRLEDALTDYDACVTRREEQVRREGGGELRRELAAAHMNRANVLTSLGRLEDALADHAACVALREDLVSHEGRREMRNDLARAYMNRGVTFRNLGRLEEALADQSACVALTEELVRREGRRELRNDLARGYLNRGNALAVLGRLEEALADFASCLALLEELVGREGRRELRNDLAAAYLTRGEALAQTGRLEEALADCTACLALREDLVRREGRRELRNDLAAAHMNRGNALACLGRPEDALADFAACIALREELVRREGRRELRHDLATAYLNRANALLKVGSEEEALAHYGACIALFEELVRREGRRDLANRLATAYLNRGVIFRNLLRDEEALADCDACVALREELVRREDRPELRHELASSYLNRGTARSELGRPQEALADYAACIALFEELVRREDRRGLAGYLAWGYAARADLLLQLGQSDEACRLAREAVTILRTEVPRTGRADLRRVLEFAEQVASHACG